MRKSSSGNVNATITIVLIIIGHTWYLVVWKKKRSPHTKISTNKHKSRRPHSPFLDYIGGLTLMILQLYTRFPSCLLRVPRSDISGILLMLYSHVRMDIGRYLTSHTPCQYLPGIQYVHIYLIRDETTNTQHYFVPVLLQLYKRTRF